MDRVPQETLVLVRAAQEGDRRALEDLFVRYLPRVRQIAALRVGRRLQQLAEFEDIAQEALLKAFQGLGRFEQRSEGSFRNWLASCVECEILMVLRGAKAEKRGGGRVRRFGDADSTLLVSSILAAKDPSPSAVAGARELSEKIEQALLDMPDHHREVILLRNLCEMSYAEIARTMGLGHEETARKAFSRALKRLREVLDV